MVSYIKVLTYKLTQADFTGLGFNVNPDLTKGSIWTFNKETDNGLLVVVYFPEDGNISINRINNGKEVLVKAITIFDKSELIWLFERINLSLFQDAI